MGKSSLSGLNLDARLKRGKLISNQRNLYDYSDPSINARNKKEVARRDFKTLYSSISLVSLSVGAALYAQARCLCQCLFSFTYCTLIAYNSARAFRPKQKWW